MFDEPQLRSFDFTTSSGITIGSLHTSEKKSEGNRLESGWKQTRILGVPQTKNLLICLMSVGVWILDLPDCKSGLQTNPS